MQIHVFSVAKRLTKNCEFDRIRSLCFVSCPLFSVAVVEFNIKLSDHLLLKQ